MSELPAKDQPELVSIGRLWKVRGNRGELLGELDSEQPGREEKLKTVVLERQGRRQRFEVEDVWRHGGQPVFKFAGLDSISDAEAWEMAELFVDAADVVPPSDGEYSHRDLVGCTMVSAMDGRMVGVVVRVDTFGGPDLLAVKLEQGGEVLVPFAKSICKEIDVAAKTIRVELPEGLLDL